MSDAAREEYLKKIRTVEEIDKNGGPDVKDVPDSSGAPSGAPVDAGAAPSVGSTNYTIPAVKKWPEKIQLPSGTRGDYNKAATAYAQKNITNTDVFTTLDPAKFDTVAPRFIGEGYLRKDFVYYLNELHSIVTPKLGVTKLYITSTFRTQAHQDWIYRNSDKKVTNGPHMGGIAVDIGVTGDDRYTVADAAYYMGFGGIAVGEGFVHIDISVKSFWNYPPVPTYHSPDKKYG